MNIIPSIFERREVEQVSLGNSAVFDDTAGISALVLNRGSRHYREKNLETLLRYGFKQIVSIENYGEDYDLAETVKKFPQVKFVKLNEKLSAGELINIGIGNVSTDFALAMWSDVKIAERQISPKVLDAVREGDFFCIAPSIRNSRSQNLPVKMSPEFSKGNFHTSVSQAFADGERTLYPFDFMGIYNCKKFRALGGFDYTICQNYWQNLDFFMRAALCGEKVFVSTTFHLVYDDEIESEDRSDGGSAKRFFLKNIAPTIDSRGLRLSKRAFFKYWHSSPYGFFSSLRHWREARDWLEENGKIFKFDAAHLVAAWQK